MCCWIFNRGMFSHLIAIQVLLGLVGIRTFFGFSCGWESPSRSLGLILAVLIRIITLMVAWNPYLRLFTSYLSVLMSFNSYISQLIYRTLSWRLHSDISAWVCKENTHQWGLLRFVAILYSDKRRNGSP